MKRLTTLLLAILLAQIWRDSADATAAASITPTVLGAFTAPNLPSTHDAGDGPDNVVIPFDLAHLAQFSNFSLHRVRLDFAFQTENSSYANEVHLKLTSPDGTEFIAPHKIDDTAGPSSNSVYRVELPDFYGETFAGLWTVTIWDEYNDAGDDFTVNELSLTLLGEEIAVASGGLIGWWPLDNSNQGALMLDHSGHNNDAYPEGNTGPAYFANDPSPLHYSDRTGTYFFGGDDYFRVPNNVGQLDSDTMTVAAWILYEGSEAIDNADGGLFSMRGASGIRFTLFRLVGGHLQIETAEAEGRQVANVFPAHSWVHLAVAFGETDTQVYINGELAQTFTNYTLNRAATGNDLHIGRNFNPQLYGQMTDVRLYNRPLSADEVATLGKVNWSTEPIIASEARYSINEPAIVTTQFNGLLSIGGRFGNGNSVRTVKEIRFYSNSAHSKTGMNFARGGGHTATRLQDGRVLVAGGFEFDAANPATKLELYDELNDVWMLGPDYSSYGNTATLLADGRVLLVGGFPSYERAYVFDPADDSLTRSADLETSRYGHTATLLPDGTVLIVGGLDNGGTFEEVGSAEIWNPATGQWSTVTDPSVARYGHTANLIEVNGVPKVAIIGGRKDHSFAETQNIELYDIATQQFTIVNTDSSLLARFSHATVMLADGSLLIIGGTVDSGGTDTTSVARYVPNANTLNTAPSLTYARSLHTATTLGDGRVAVFGGRSGVSGNGFAEVLFHDAFNAVQSASLQTFALDPFYLSTFRTEHLQDSCVGGINCDARPAAMPIADDFSDYEDGEFYWQFCADYGDPAFAPDGVAGLADIGSCPTWESLSSTEKQNRLGGGTFDSYTHFTNVRNESVRVRDAIAALVTYPIDPRWQSGTAVEFNKVVRDIATTHMLFGNEFLVKATRLPDDLNAFDDDALLDRELELLRRAQHQYMLAVQSLLDLAKIRVAGVDDVYLIEWLDVDTLRLLTYASEQQVTALEEIIRRELLRGVTPGETLLTEVAQAIATQNAQTLLLSDLFDTLAPDDVGTSEDESVAAFVAVGGDTLINNIGRLSQLSEQIRAGLNPLGYDAEYVPLQSVEDMLTFVCGSDHSACTGGLMAGLISAENDYIASTLQYNQNQADLGDALNDLHDEAATELTALCGANSGTNGPEWSACDAGLMEQNRLDFIAANQAAAIAWTRAEQINQLIALEESTAQIVSNAIVQTGQQLSAAELSKGKLEAYRTTSTSFTASSSTETASVEASVTASVKASVSAFPPGGNVEASVEVAATASVGVSWESSKGSNTETTFDINAQKIANIESMSVLREAEKEATISNAESAAEVKRLLLEQSTLLLEYELALVDINKVIAEHNHLVDQYQLLKDQLAASEVDVQESYANDPYFRIVKDRKAQIFQEKLRITTHYAYLTAKAFEYLTLEPLDGSNGVNINDLYIVRSKDGLQDFMQTVVLANNGVNLGFNKHRYKVSFARHILGLTDEVIQNDTNDTLTPAQIETERAARFQQYVSDHTVDGVVIIDFATLADLPAATNYFNVNLANLRITGASNASLGCTVNYSCFGLWLNFVTDQPGSDFDTNGRPDLRLTHGGHATYMRANRTFASYRPGPSRIIDAPSTFGNEDRTSDFKANINMSVDVSAENPTFLTNDFQDLSVATSRWRLEIDLSASANQALDLSQLNDFEIRMDAVGFSANQSRDGQLESAEAIRLAAVQNGEPIPAAALATVQNWLDQQPKPSDNSRHIAATPAFTLTDQTYMGRTFTLEPIALDATSAGFEIFFNSDNSITGTLCAYCSAGYENDVAITGTWETASITPTFTFETTPFVDVNGVLHTLALTGEMQTRSRNLTVPDAPFVYAPFSGNPADGVQFLLGTFSETVSGVAAESITRTGDFILTPPTPDYVPNAGVPTAVSVQAAGADAVGSVLWLVVLVAAVGLPTISLLSSTKGRIWARWDRLAQTDSSKIRR